MKTSGNTILITGGTSGIGFEFAKQLLALGNVVAVTGRDQKKLDAMKTRLPGVRAIKSDASRPDEIEALRKTVTSELPKLNVLLNNAGKSAIVNVTSGLAFVPLPTSPIYCATKAGLHSFSLSLRVQLKNTRVKVFEVAPPATETELLSGMSAEDRKGVDVMKVEDMVAASIKGFEADRYEIRPGQANSLKLMSRVAPDFILKQLSRPMDRLLAATKN
jgi:uncharacterized oxidoreductase